MSTSCSSYAQNCSYNCCDVWGDCPLYQSSCYYYYTRGLSPSTGGIIGAAVFAVIMIVLIAYCCWKKRQARAAMQQLNMSTQQSIGGYGVAQPVNNVYLPQTNQYMGNQYMAGPIGPAMGPGQMAPLAPMAPAYGAPYGTPVYNPY